MMKAQVTFALAGMLIANCASLASTAFAHDLPVRWNTGGAVWSTSLSAFETFLKDGVVTDRGLAAGLARSGWSPDEVRTGMTKSYDVDLVGVSKFLYSDAGVKFLKNATNSYFPYWSMHTYAVQALRSAIISDAADGSISSAGIMRALPTDFRLADFCNTYDGAQNICAEGRCKAGSAQCTSLLSWYVFLPACIQANQLKDPVAQVREEPASEPAPAPAPMPEPGPAPMREPGPAPMREPAPAPFPEPEPSPVPMPEPVVRGGTRKQHLKSGTSIAAGKRKEAREVERLATTAESAKKQKATTYKELSALSDPGSLKAFKDVDKKLKSEMTTANSSLTAPKEIMLNTTAQVQLNLSIKESLSELTRQLKYKGERYEQRVRVSASMAARLTGPNFKIVTTGDEKQSLGTTNTLTWIWDITPTQSGDQILHLTLTAYLSDNTSSVETFDRKITVRVRPGQRLMTFVSTYWQWLWVTLLVPMIGWLIKSFNRKIKETL